ncbi:hypothetical protein I552_0532 [Mycobacterium xenopi 3993]|nr:hypothetical protein I552_0532 [Mycobacterium xenopi 3993]
MPIGGATPMSALSALLQPLEQAVEQAATPATASAETSHHNDDPPPVRARRSSTPPAGRWACPTSGAAATPPGRPVGASTARGWSNTALPKPPTAN